MFLDTELDESDHRRIASQVLGSGYSPTEVESALWQEVFPSLEFNLRVVAGENWGFDVDWLEQQIRGSGKKYSADEQPGVARVVREEWGNVRKYFPASWFV